MVTIHSLDGKVLDSSDDFVKLVGHTRDSLKQIDIYTLFYPGDVGRIYANSHTVLGTETTQIEYRLKTVDGWKWMRVKSLLSNKLGLIICWTIRVPWYRALYLDNKYGKAH